MLVVVYCLSCVVCCFVGVVCVCVVCCLFCVVRCFIISYMILVVIISSHECCLRVPSQSSRRLRVSRRLLHVVFHYSSLVLL